MGHKGSGIDYEALFQVAPIGLAVLDADLRYVGCNAALAEINGIPEDAHLGHTIGELLPEIAPQVEAPFRDVFRTGEPRSHLVVTGGTRRAPHVRRVWLEDVRPLKNAAGQVGHILVGVQELTDLAETEDSLRESERTLRASQQLSPDGFTILRAVRDEDGRVVDFVCEYANPAAERMLKAGPLAGQSLLDVLPGDRDRPELFPRYVRLLSEPEPHEVELPYEYGGGIDWFRNSAVGIDQDRVAVAFRNISRRKHVEAQLRLVTAEFRHRVKNVIAIVSGLVSQTAKYTKDVPAFASALAGRLTALAAAQDLLSMEVYSSVPLEDVVRAALAPFGYPNLHVCPGPQAPVRSGAVVSLTLALYELATNAVKYGGLSVADGSVTLTWTVEDRRLRLMWVEASGPKVTAPASEGFGSRLLQDAARGLPGGTVRREFRQDGLRVELGFDLQDAPAED